MLIQTLTTKRPTVSDPWFEHPTDFVEIRDSFQKMGKILERVEQLSEDGLVKTTVMKYADEDAFLELINHPIAKIFQEKRRQHNRQYNISNQSDFSIVDDFQN